MSCHVLKWLWRKSIDEDLMMHFEKRMTSKNNQRSIIFIDDVDDKNRNILHMNLNHLVTLRALNFLQNIIKELYHQIFLKREYLVQKLKFKIIKKNICYKIIADF